MYILSFSAFVGNEKKKLNDVDCNQENVKAQIHGTRDAHFHSQKISRDKN